MNIWVKEHTNILTINKISMWIKDSLDILPFEDFSYVCDEDIIIISEAEADYFDISYYNTYTILIYEKYFKKISQSIIEEINNNFDYYYLKHSLHEAINPEINTLFTGSSYGLFGIDDRLINNGINLSLASQDLYYSLKGVYSILEKNDNIHNIVLCMGYYYFHSDLSRTQNTYELSRISKVYNKLFDDVHNCILLPPTQSYLPKSNIFDIQNVTNLFSTSEFQKGYFTEKRIREDFALKEWDDKSKNWINLSEHEKDNAGNIHVQLHNKSIHRIASLNENIDIFNKFTTFCEKKDINVLVVVTPVTKYYKKYLAPQFKDIFYDILNNTSKVHLIDFIAEDYMFSDEHFIDMDHLNTLGARTMTEIVIDILSQIS